jgi:hypothetical protein
MIDLLERQQRFIQDDIPTRLAQLANHLAEIKSLAASSTNLDAAPNLMREGQFFLEWTVPDIVETDVDLAAELVDLGRTLARWQSHWPKICLDAATLAQVSVEAGTMSERVLEISAMLTAIVEDRASVVRNAN